MFTKFSQMYIHICYVISILLISLLTTFCAYLLFVAFKTSYTCSWECITSSVRKIRVRWMYNIICRYIKKKKEKSFFEVTFCILVYTPLDATLKCHQLVDFHEEKCISHSWVKRLGYMKYIEEVCLSLDLYISHIKTIHL